jgi:hypothetical protein
VHRQHLLKRCHHGGNRNGIHRILAPT